MVRAEDTEDHEVPEGEIDYYQKDIFFYGQDGNAESANYTEGEIARLELMWRMDYWIMMTRGIVQGWTRGFYKSYEYELHPRCLGRETNEMFFDIYMAYKSLDVWNILRTFGLFYNFYYIWDFDCELEKHAYDVSLFCFDHDCSG